MARAGAADCGRGVAYAAALPAADAGNEGGDETLSGAAERLDRRGVLPRRLRRAGLQRRDGAVLGRDGRRLDLRRGGGVHLLRADAAARPLRVRPPGHALRLSAPLAAPGAGVSDDDLARHALFGGGVHDRPAARLPEAGESLRDTLPLPLGAGGVSEDLLFRHSRGPAPLRRAGSGALPLFQGVYRRQFPQRYETRPAGDEPAAAGRVHGTRGFLYGDHLAAALGSVLNGAVSGIGERGKRTGAVSSVRTPTGFPGASLPDARVLARNVSVGGSAKFSRNIRFGIFSVM